MLAPAASLLGHTARAERSLTTWVKDGVSARSPICPRRGGEPYLFSTQIRSSAPRAVPSPAAVAQRSPPLHGSSPG